MTGKDSGIMNLVIGFAEAAKNLRPLFIEKWIEGEVNDFDMDMILIEEKKHRSSTYKKLVREI